MALFDDDPSPRPQGRSRRERIGWIALGVAAAIGLTFALLPSPYVIEQPGPVYDTLGVAEHEGEEVPLIEIPDAETFPTDGELNLLTVTVLGRPGQTPNWLDVLGAWFDRTRSVVPVEAIFPPGVTDADRDAQNTAAMVDSQQDAIAAALVELGYDFPRDVTVAGVLDDSPAAGVLEEGDIITEVNGTAVNSVDELRAAVRENGGGTPASLLVVRDGEEQVIEVTPVERDGSVVLGVGVRMDYEFPIDVELQLDNVGGPSAGMMFALGIIDKLTPGCDDRRRDRGGHRHHRFRRRGRRHRRHPPEALGRRGCGRRLVPRTRVELRRGHRTRARRAERVRGVDPRRGAHDRGGDRRGCGHLGLRLLPRSLNSRFQGSRP